MSDESEVTIREKLAHIDQMQAETKHLAALREAQVQQALADIDRKRQEMRFAPWQLVLTGMTGGAALFAAGAAFTKLIGG